MPTIEIPTALGFTALQAAHERAVESERPDALFRDPFAKAMVAIVEEARAASGGEAASAPRVSDDFAWLFGNYLALRTLYLDRVLVRASRDGISQVALLAAGLDSRAYRLPWAAGTAVYEVDRPDLFAFKREVARRAALDPTARLVTVAADLREDWVGPLVAAGLDPARPTIWVLEGILRYLDRAQADGLLAGLTAASAAGSRLTAVYSVGNTVEPARRTGRDGAGDVATHAGNLRPGPSVAPGEWLPAHGWSVDATDIIALARSVGRSPPPAMDPSQGGATCHLIEARLPEA